MAYKKNDILTIYCGLPGSGKTSLAALFAKKAFKKNKKKENYRVFSNCPITGCYEFHVDDLGQYDMSNSLILLDEAALDFNSRDWSRFSKEKQFFFRYYRHFQNEVKIFSQDWDGVDKVIRNVAWRYVLIERTFIPGIIKTRVMAKKALDIDDNTQQPLTRYYWVKFSTRFHYVGKAWKLFNTLSRPQLPQKDFKKY